MTTYLGSDLLKTEFLEFRRHVGGTEGIGKEVRLSVFMRKKLLKTELKKIVFEEQLSEKERVLATWRQVKRRKGAKFAIVGGLHRHQGSLNS